MGDRSVVLERLVCGLVLDGGGLLVALLRAGRAGPRRPSRRRGPDPASAVGRQALGHQPLHAPELGVLRSTSTWRAWMSARAALCAACACFTAASKRRRSMFAEHLALLHPSPSFTAAPRGRRTRLEEIFTVVAACTLPAPVMVPGDGALA